MPFKDVIDIILSGGTGNLGTQGGVDPLNNPGGGAMSTNAAYGSNMLPLLQSILDILDTQDGTRLNATSRNDIEPFRVNPHKGFMAKKGGKVKKGLPPETEKQINDYISYLNSPEYLDRLSNFRTKEDAIAERNARLRNLKDLKVRLTDAPRDSRGFSNITGEYLPDEHLVKLYGEGALQGVTPLHEIDHGATRGNDNFNKNELQYIKGARKDRMTLLENPSTLPMVGAYNYYGNPTEMHARMGVMRQFAADYGIHNNHGQSFTKDDISKIRNKYKSLSKEDQKKWKNIVELDKLVKDDDTLINLLNTVAMEDTGNSVEFMAQDGGRVEPPGTVEIDPYEREAVANYFNYIGGDLYDERAFKPWEWWDREMVPRRQKGRIMEALENIGEINPDSQSEGVTILPSKDFGTGLDKVKNLLSTYLDPTGDHYEPFIFLKEGRTDNTLLHESVHASTLGDIDNREKKKIEKILKNSSPIRGYFEENYDSVKDDPDRIEDYFRMPSEIHARIQATREYLYRNDIHDTWGENMTDEQIDELWKLKDNDEYWWEQRDSNVLDLMNAAGDKKTFKRLMNEVAAVQPEKEDPSIQMAQKGGPVREAYEKVAKKEPPNKIGRMLSSAAEMGADFFENLGLAAKRAYDSVVDYFDEDDPISLENPEDLMIRDVLVTPDLYPTRNNRKYKAPITRGFHNKAKNFVTEDSGLVVTDTNDSKIHRSRQQRAGRSFDVAYKDRRYNPQRIIKTIQDGDEKDLRVVYETTSKKEYRDLIKKYPKMKGKIKYIPHATAPHFSVYDYQMGGTVSMPQGQMTTMQELAPAYRQMAGSMGAGLNLSSIMPQSIIDPVFGNKINLMPTVGAYQQGGGVQQYPFGGETKKDKWQKVREFAQQPGVTEEEVIAYGESLGFKMSKDKGFLGNVFEGIGTLAKKVAPILPFIPGVGPVASTAVGVAGNLLTGGGGGASQTQQGGGGSGGYGPQDAAARLEMLKMFEEEEDEMLNKNKKLSFPTLNALLTGSQLSRPLQIFQTGGFVQNEQNQLMPIQTEVGEMLMHLDGTISPVNATKKHKYMDDDEVTDIVPEGTYVFSNDKSIKMPYDYAEDVTIGVKAQPYSEMKKGKVPEEVVFADLWPGNSTRKMTPAELADRIRKKFNTIDREDVFEFDDIFTSLTNATNINSRMPYLQALIEFNEEEKDEDDILVFGKGGRVYRKKNVKKAGGGGMQLEDWLQIGATALPLIKNIFGIGDRGTGAGTSQAYMLGSAPMYQLGLTKNVRAQEGALDRSMGRFQDLEGNLNQYAGLQTGANIMGRLAQETELPSYDFSSQRSRLQNFNTRTPRSFVDALSTPNYDMQALAAELGPRGFNTVANNLLANQMATRNNAMMQQYNADRNMGYNVMQALNTVDSSEQRLNIPLQIQEIRNRNAQRAGIAGDVSGYFGRLGDIQTQMTPIYSDLDLQRAQLAGQIEMGTANNMVKIGAVSGAYPSGGGYTNTTNAGTGGTGTGGTGTGGTGTGGAGTGQTPTSGDLYGSAEFGCKPGLCPSDSSPNAICVPAEYGNC